jgi:hypothetical protein
MNISPVIPPIRIPTEVEIVQPTEHQENRVHFRMVHASFRMFVIKLRKYESSPYMTKRTFHRIRSSFLALKQTHAIAMEFLRTYLLPDTILNPLIVVVQELSYLSMMIDTKFIVDELENEIEWSDEE